MDNRTSCHRQFLPHKRNKALSVIKLLLDGRPCTILMDSGCSRFFMNNSNCVTWSKMSMNVLEVKGKYLKSQWIVVLNPFKSTVLVEDSRFLGFDPILGMDIIRNLDGVRIISSGMDVFSQRKLPICAPLKIDETDFSAELDKNTNIRTASWK